MSTFPKTEAILLEVRQALGCKSFQTVKKRKFATAQGNMNSHQAMFNEVMQDIFDKLEIDEAAQEDLLANLWGFATAYKEVTSNTWTFEADQRQIVWMLLGYFYMPGVARHLAFWNIHEILDRGMPGGRFWYLPELREVNGQSCLYLPVAQVVDWLLDLLGMPVEKFADKHSESTDVEHDSLRRSLYNWRDKTTIQLDTIQKYFSDDFELEFKGTFSRNNSSTPAEQFSDALKFVKRKGLTASMLRLEIPMTYPGRLEKILDGHADDDEQATFVEYLSERYAPPSPRTIRQRLLVARTMQYGYVCLLKFLCPGVEPTCSDAQQNKLLQLIAIYKYIYNLTVDAWRNCGHQGEHAENTWFEEHLPDLSKEGLFLSILPSCRETANLEFAALLTHCFSDMQPGGELEDHVMFHAESILFSSPQSLERIAVKADEDDSAANLIERMKKSSPWRALQGESRFRVVGRVAQSGKLTPRARKASVQRLRELALTPSELIQTIFFELHTYLNGERKNRPKDSQAKVEALLAEAEVSEGYELWRAVLLQYRGKHLLACNDFQGAAKLFREALEASNERHYGMLRGEVARECFATAVANHKLIVNNHEKYYREMLVGGMLDDNEQIPSIEETARSVSKYFWETLYKPYYGFSNLKPRSEGIFKDIVPELLQLFADYSSTSFKEWIKKNRKLLKTSLPDVEGNTVLILLMKMYGDFHQRLPMIHQMAPAGSQDEVQQIHNMLDGWKKFVEQLVKEAPAQLNITDLKGQTPIMLAAERGDTNLVNTMLKAGADPDIQDWHGMTALHSAIKSHDTSCVDALLDHPCRLDKITCDGQSPLHTASWSANLYSVERLLQQAPELAWQRNDYGMTPLELVEDLIEHPENLQMFASKLAQSGRRCASKQELLGVVQLLEQAEPV